MSERLFGDPPGGAISSRPPEGRWMQLILGVIGMVMVSNYQYGWTLFVHPMAAAHHWSVAAIQVAFSLFIALETWLTPVDGWIADKFGPKLIFAGAGILVAVSWIINSYTDTLFVLYIGAILGGAGAGAVYSTAIGNAVKWFADKRGLAVGITAAGYGAGSVLTIIPIRLVIHAAGYQTAFFWFGLIQGAIVFLVAWALRAPQPGEAPLAVSTASVKQTSRSYTPSQMMATPTFWLLYVMFVLISASGLMATAQIALIAHSYNVANTVILLGGSVLTVALIFDGFANGFARPFFGWVSDNIGRENTMAIAFAIGGVAYWLLGATGHSPWLFVIFAALIFFTWGEIFSLFPSTCTDSFGAKFATVNLCCLYTAKGLSAFLVPLANVLKAATGSWHAVFVLTAIANFVVVLLALFVLKPLRMREQRSFAASVAGHPAE